MFRVLFTSAILVSLFVACGQSNSSKISSSSTSEAGEARVLQAIDDICADTWCAGDFNFAFKRVMFDFDANTTLVEFSTYPWGLESEATDSSCLIQGFSQEASILDEDGRLNLGFHDQISACVKALEDSSL